MIFGKKRVDCCEQGAHIYRMGARTQSVDYTIALAGNPNTGKSTVFNALTGLKQHTGNWPGKTVTHAEGAFKYAGKKYRIVDLPGTYSLLSTSEDEEIARNHILFSNPSVTVIVCDASRLERNLNLVLQILQISSKCVVCLNLLDEAKRNKVDVNIRALSRRLGVPVIGTSARSGKGIGDLLKAIHEVATGERIPTPHQLVELSDLEEHTLDTLSHKLESFYPEIPNARWLTLRLLDHDNVILHELQSGNLSNFLADHSPPTEEQIETFIAEVEEQSKQLGERFQDSLSEGIYEAARRICAECVSYGYKGHRAPLDVKIDRIVTSRIWGFPIMLVLLGLVLWITIIGANVPSALLSDLLVEFVHGKLMLFAEWSGMPWWLSGFLFNGVYLASAWVISVMLPPMAIFFPLFTLLEDFGYLPRVAFNLDEMFRRSGAHGKQSLTMCMGFGCNAAGIVSTRIIDSPRERLIAIITNNFSLCNGRWPTQIVISSLFIGVLVPASWSGTISVLTVIVIALMGIGFMFLSSLLLSKTVLRGQASTFNLELPPYRPPAIWRTLYTSFIDRTLIVLWRAIVFAAPAGALIWLSCNIHIGNLTIAQHLIDFLSPLGWLMGLNGIILLAYVLAIPANEIVVPTILMLIVLTTGAQGVGAGNGVLFEDDLFMSALFQQNGWTLLTAINLMLLCLLHNPCSTTIYTIYKETKSTKWTALATFLPLVIGFVVTVVVAGIWRLIA